MKQRRKRGMVLSLAIVILVILLVLGTSVATMGTGNLNIALSQLNSEKGFQAAEAGLAYAYNDLALGQLNGPSGGLLPNRTYTLSQSDNHDQAYVEIFENPTGTTPQPAGCPVQIPQGYIYLTSTGRLRNGTNTTLERKVGAMVCLGGGGTLSYGVNCRDFVLNQGKLVAYDLKNNMQVPGYTVAACNSTSPSAGKIQLGSPATPVIVDGNIMLPAGTGTGIGPTSVVQGSCTLTSGSSVQNFASQLNFPKINVPVLPLKATTQVTSPGTLPSGYYPNLRISANQSLEGRYVVDTLTVDNGCKLRVDTDTAVELVIRSLTYVDSTPFLVHDGSSNSLKVNYTGTSALTLNLDRHSHLSLLAPNADVTINASDLTLGAFAARRLDVRMVNPTDRFCFDPAAAQPVVPPPPTSATMGPFTPPASKGSPQTLIPGYKPVTVMGRQRF